MLRPLEGDLFGTELSRTEAQQIVKRRLQVWSGEN
jgi:hypothetical protein